MTALAALAACSPYRQVSSIAQVGKDDRVVIGEIKIVDGNMADWGSGELQGIGLMVGYDLAVRNGKAIGDPVYGQPLASDDGTRPMTATGGVFHMAVENRTVYLLSLQADFEALIFGETVKAPLLLKIPPSPDRCIYVGRILVKMVEKVIVVKVVDNYDRFKDVYAKYVDGCELKKALASDVDGQDVIRSVRQEATRHH
jgi:hypothetical protein